MASPAQCFYCFESLAASFADAEPPKLAVVEDLWEEFESSKELVSGSDAGEFEDGTEAKVPAESRRDATRASGDPELRQPSTGQLLEDEAARQNPEPETRPEPLKLPSIGRLQELSASSRSSSASTPSALSTSSSRSVLTGATSPISPPTPPPAISQARLVHRARYPKSTPDTAYPLFVTWNTVSRSGHKALRGCIGTFEAQDLEGGLKSYALTSAFGDTRFSPIPVSLLPSLSCSLTLLSSFETCSHALDWDLGTHGIRISFTHRGRRYGATYLPDVAVEQGWTKEETVESLMRKAGWDGYAGAAGLSRRLLRGAISSSAQHQHPWEDVSDFRTVRYQGLKASASYAEWQEWRKWVAATTTEHTAWLSR